jgi:hypothetical protein
MLLVTFIIVSRCTDTWTSSSFFTLIEIKRFVQNGTWFVYSNVKFNEFILDTSCWLWCCVSSISFRFVRNVGHLRGISAWLCCPPTSLTSFHVLPNFPAFSKTVLFRFDSVFFPLWQIGTERARSHLFYDWFQASRGLRSCGLLRSD